jgi:hypothetical protein
MPSIVEQYIYNTFDYNNTEKIVSAGFPITKFIEKSNEEKMILGGNGLLDEHENISILTNIDILESKAIPIGLVYNYNMPVKCSQYIDLNQRRLKSAGADLHSSWSMTDKDLNAAPLGRIEIFSGLKIKERVPKESDEVINEDMFDKLLSTVRVLTKAQKQKKNKTKKNESDIQVSSNTRKHRIGKKD